VIASSREPRPCPPVVTWVSSRGLTTVLACGQLCPPTVSCFLEGVLAVLAVATEPVMLDASDLVVDGPVAINAIAFLHRAAAGRGVDFAVVGIDPGVWFPPPAGEPAQGFLNSSPVPRSTAV